MVDYSEHAFEQSTLFPSAEPEQDVVAWNADLAWATVQEARRIAQSEPAEGQEPIDLKPITFKERDAERGLTVIFTVGAVVGTPYDGVSLVPERTRAILRKMHIPFTIFTPPKRKSH